MCMTLPSFNFLRLLAAPGLLVAVVMWSPAHAQVKQAEASAPAASAAQAEPEQAPGASGPSQADPLQVAGPAEPLEQATQELTAPDELNLPPLPWPKTFVGQPDFMFRREAVIADYQRRKGGEAEKYVATMDDLLTDRVINPFVPRPRVADIGRSKYSQQSFAQHLDDVGLGNRPVSIALPNLEVGASIEVQREDGEKVVATLEENSRARLGEDEMIKIEVTPEGVIVESVAKDTIASAFESLFTGGGAGQSDDLEGLPDYDFSNTQLPILPSMEGSGRIDLSAFEGFLDNIIIRSTRAQTENMQDRDFARELARVTIQAVVTSPQKYAIINNKRYHVGDRFLLPVRMKLEAKDGIEDVINAYLPSKESVSEDVYKQYEELRDKALEKYRDRIGITEDSSDGVHKVSVTVKDISRRKVIVSVFDKKYPLEIKLAL